MISGENDFIWILCALYAFLHRYIFHKYIEVRSGKLQVSGNMDKYSLGIIVSFNDTNRGKNEHYERSVK